MASSVRFLNPLYHAGGLAREKAAEDARRKAQD